MLAGLILASVWFAIFLVAQVIAFRLRPRQQRSRSIFCLLCVALLGHPGSVLLLHWSTPLSLGGSSLALSLLSGPIAMACLFVLYMPFYYTINTSLSVETLAMLHKAGGRLPLEVVQRRFCSLDFLQDRLRTMEANGYFDRVSEETWQISQRGRRVATVMTSVKRLLRLGPGG